MNDAKELGTLNELLIEAEFEIPEDLKSDTFIQPEFVNFGSPFVAEVA